MYIYIELEKNYFIINERGCILVCLKKLILKIIIYILFGVYRWVWIWRFCDGFGILNVIGWFGGRFVEGV